MAIGKLRWTVGIGICDTDRAFPISRVHDAVWVVCNALVTFQRLMEYVLADLHWTTCLVYLDDIIIFSKSIQKHLEQLSDLFARLKGAGLKTKSKKCRLLQTSVGHIISGESVRY